MVAGDRRRVVSGTVTHERSGEPAPGLTVTVEVDDQAFEESLGSATTDPDGRYAVEFDPGEHREGALRRLERAVEGAPVAYVEVSADDGSLLVATEDRPFRVAGEAETVDVAVPDGGSRPLTAWDAGGAVGAQIDGAGPEEPDDTDGVEVRCDGGQSEESSEAESESGESESEESSEAESESGESSEGEATESATATAGGDDGEDVFRFMTVRPPEKTDPDRHVSVSPSRSHGLVSDLQAVHETEEPRRAAVDLLERERASESFLRSLPEEPLDLAALRERVNASDGGGAEPFDDVVESVLGTSPSELVESGALEDLEGRLLDSQIAASLYPMGASLETREAIRDGVRLVDGIRRAAASESPTVADVREKLVTLPRGVPTLPTLPTGSDGDAVPDAESEDLGSTVERLQRVRRARDELERVAAGESPRSEAGARAESEGAEPNGGEPRKRPATETDGDGERDDDNGDDENGEDDEFVPGAPKLREPEGATGPGRTASDREEREDEGSDEVSRQLGQAFGAISEIVERLSERRQRPRTLTEERFDELSDEVQATVSELDVRPGRSSLAEAADRLQSEEARLQSRVLDATVGNYERLVATEDGPVLLNDAVSEPGEMRATSGLFGFGARGRAAEEEPTERRDVEGVTVLGFGDLRVVRQVGPRYEPGEVAHVENVMATETRERVHEESTVTEEKTRREEETVTTEEEDLQTTERKEVKRESERVINEEWGVEAGVNVSAKYGAVSVDTNFGYSRSRSEERSRRTSVETAREITEKATRRVENRVTTETVKRIREEISEINRHAFENADDEHITGIYRWLTKTYRMDVHEYDQPRLMVEFVVPDPAAGYRFAQGARPKEKTAEKPVEPKAVRFPDDVDEGPEREDGDPVYVERLSYDDITPENYQWYATHYGAEDVPEPPAEEMRRTIDFQSSAADSESDSEKPAYETKYIDVPDGYQIEDVHVFSAWLHREDYDIGAATRVTVGAESDAASERIQHIPYDASYDSDPDNVFERIFEGASDDPVKATAAEHERFGVYSSDYDRLPITIATRNVYGYAILATAELDRTQSRLRQWKAEVHRKIMRAYRDRRDEYENEVESARIGQGVTIEGENPEANREIERTELKRGAIELLRGRSLDVDAVTTPSEREGEYPSFPVIEQQYVDSLKHDLQFYEQAFEWSEGTYVFYPYYWAEKDSWVSKLTRDDPDPKFESFLTAGAARFVVPVRRDFEQTVLCFMQNGCTYFEDGPIEDVDDPRYRDVVNELRDRQEQTPQGSQYTGDHWFNSVPTSLVKLQASDELPDMVTPVDELYDVALDEVMRATEAAPAAERAMDGGWTESTVPRDEGE